MWRQIGCILVLGLAIAPANLARSMPQGSGQPQVESEDKTFESAKAGGMGVYDRPREQYLRDVAGFNPIAKERIYQFISAADDKREKAHAVGFLGHIGDPSDIDRILNLLHGYHGPLDVWDHYFVAGSIGAIAVMSYRGIEEATAALDQMIDPDFWKRYDFVDPSAKGGNYFDTHTEYAIFALSSKSRSMDPKFPEKVQAVLELLRDEDQKRIYAAQVNNAMHDFRAQEIAKGDLVNYVYAQDQAKRGLPTPLKPPRAAKSEYRRVLEARAARADLAASAFGTVLVEEAIAEFNRVAAALRQDDLAYVFQHVADNGRPVLLADEVSSASLKSLLENGELTGDLAQEKALLRDILPNSLDAVPRAIFGLRFADAPHVVPPPAGVAPTPRVAPTAAPTPPPAQDPRQTYDVIVVHLSVARLESLRRQTPRLFRNSVSPFPEAQDPTQPPAVTMVWQAGRWYWNPFGW